MMPTWTQFGNTVAWMVLVALVSAALGGIWSLTGRWLAPRDWRSEDWRQWAEDRRVIEAQKRQPATRRRRR